MPAKVLPFSRPAPAPDGSLDTPYFQKRYAVLRAISFSPEPLLTNCLYACLTADATTLALVYWLLNSRERSNKQ